VVASLAWASGPSYKTSQGRPAPLRNRNVRDDSGGPTEMFCMRAGRPCVRLAREGWAARADKMLTIHSSDRPYGARRQTPQGTYSWLEKMMEVSAYERQAGVQRV
jgi:hypothetical protein